MLHIRLRLPSRQHTRALALALVLTHVQVTLKFLIVLRTYVVSNKLVLHAFHDIPADLIQNSQL